jgi:CBS domain-containing protein
MNAHDLMSTDLVTVAPETPLRDVAKTLLRHRISAVPVVDDGGALVGIVSEGDLIGRKKTERETRSEWWLMRLADGEPLNDEFLAHLQSPLAVAREIMSSPVIAVSEDTPIDEIATLMGAHRVKRLPVLRDGHVVGVLRRADLLRTIGDGISAPVPLPPDPRPDRTASVHEFAGAERADAKAFQPTHETICGDEDLTADDLRLLVAHHGQELDAERARRRAEAAEQPIKRGPIPT